MMKSYGNGLLAATFAARAYAWGSLGHQTVAYLAQHYVSNHTAQWAQAILNDTSASYLANIATWADSYRYTAEGEFSAGFHYIDALDNPPESCNVDFERDCASSGCIVSAIANYTQRVQNPSRELDALQVNYALRWIVHFVGDISQPLHNEGLEQGGNGIKVTFANESTNIHSVWDTAIPEEFRDIPSNTTSTLTEASAWASNLVADIDDGCYTPLAASWLQGIDISQPLDTAMVWARDSNSYICSVVFPNGPETYNGTELFPEYYSSAASTVELQIAKAGYRLAAFLDGIAAGEKKVGTYWGGLGTSANDVVRRERQRHVEVKKRDLSGRDLLPKRSGMTRMERERLAERNDLGCGCTHKH